ncbi:hypothetical protein PR202_gb05649 [Eleusine coracana subsp. coracana]|uniref:RING-CH-type domain-containing protein n=1 Tax=Eleusine coracana subsp. coracana TaxID=191504 RepID=A0AAV5E6X1_ELECO|nr:hypothetical protein PR202_gb05649 [Eleusine coracana subsp. coracana]
MCPPRVSVDTEIEVASAASCRICLESSCERGDELISPCMCKGTQQFVHRSCLDHWRSVKVIAAIGGVAYLLDKDGKFINSFSGNWDHILSKNPVPFYYCVGRCSGVFGTGWIFWVHIALLHMPVFKHLAVQRIVQQHYNILTKMELTKEYVVEDLRGCYTPPKMNPEHEQRLQMLQLM